MSHQVIRQTETGAFYTEGASILGSLHPRNRGVGGEGWDADGGVFTFRIRRQRRSIIGIKTSFDVKPALSFRLLLQG